MEKRYVGRVSCVSHRRKRIKLKAKKNLVNFLSTNETGFPVLEVHTFFDDDHHRISLTEYTLSRPSNSRTTHAPKQKTVPIVMCATQGWMLWDYYHHTTTTTHNNRPDQWFFCVLCCVVPHCGYIRLLERHHHEMYRNEQWNHPF